MMVFVHTKFIVGGVLFFLLEGCRTRFEFFLLVWINAGGVAVDLACFADWCIRELRERMEYPKGLQVTTIAR